MTSSSRRKARPEHFEEKGLVDRQLNGRTVALLAMAGAVVGSVAWLTLRISREQLRIHRNATAREDLQANARRALAMKQSASPDQDYPRSRTAGEGMRPIPNTGIAPSGALNQEGHRPVLERSRKVR